MALLVRWLRAFWRRLGSMIAWGAFMVPLVALLAVLRDVLIRRGGWEAASWSGLLTLTLLWLAVSLIWALSASMVEVIFYLEPRLDPLGYGDLEAQADATRLGPRREAGRLYLTPRFVVFIPNSRRGLPADASDGGKVVIPLGTIRWTESRRWMGMLVLQRRVGEADQFMVRSARAWQQQIDQAIARDPKVTIEPVDD